MKHALLLAFLLGLFLPARAERVSFQLLGLKINGQTIRPTGDWQAFEDIRVKLLPNGMPDSADPNSTGILWAAQTVLNNPPKDYLVTVTGQFCLTGLCQTATITGTLRTSELGLVWASPPLSFTQNGMYFQTVWNTPNQNPFSTRDINIIANRVGIVPNEVPEPATLTLLGLGLAGIASRLRKRK